MPNPLDELSIILTRIKKDPCLAYGKMPLDVVHEVEEKVKQIIHDQPVFLSQPLIDIQDTINLLKIKLHHPATAKKKETYELKRTAPYLRLWPQLNERLPDFKTLKPEKENKENILSILTLTDDYEFIVKLSECSDDWFNQMKKCELIYFVTTRFHHIQKNTPKLCLGIKEHTLQNINKTRLMLEACNKTALQIEINKLKLHAKLYPGNKVVWLGTGYAVYTMMEQCSGKGAYLNSDETLWTWELNRQWMLAAAKMNFEFLLIEQHFPNIEKAILSGDAILFLAELTKQIRDKGESTQYSRRFSPTFTQMEILALLEMGCHGRKNPDGSLSLVPSQRIVQEEYTCPKKSILSLRRHHSCPDFYKSAPLPPYPNKRDRLFLPDPDVNMIERNKL
ncbi:MAG: hypothetical protein ACYCQI_14620 [Gammaproteobacteria bacterium]